MRLDRVLRPPRPNRPLTPLPNGGGVVHLAAEYWPFARTGGLAEAVRGLAEYQKAAGLPVTIILPLHRQVRARGTEMEPVGEPFAVSVGGRLEPARIWRATGGEARPDVFFVEHQEFFDRSEIYGEGADYPDNARRFAFLSLAALEALPAIAPRAAVLHTHDWHTSFAIIYLRQTYAGRRPYDRIGGIITAHNAAFQGHYTFALLAEIGLPASLYDWRYMEWYGHVNVLKGGLAFCDAATTVSPTHAVELRTPGGGFGLHHHYQTMGDRFVGILNGIDDDFWNPALDPFLTARYGPEDPGPKIRCKRAVQRTYGLPQRRRVPLVAMSARLVEQKGLDLILGSNALLEADAQFVFLGRGEPRYERALSAVAAQAPDRVAVPLAFSERAEHRLLAGADLLLMPSQYEPCGLTQMRAQRYGALPVARRVGGLNDTIEDGVSGFLFEEYKPEAFPPALDRALAAYHAPAVWDRMIRKAMRIDHGWGPSAERYQALYQRACARRATA
ncbi:MAG TPA: glycogen synthase [Gemmatimonadales bacterium]|nr:glycogen synthase [Gemmatimonadales bacterium]